MTHITTNRPPETLTLADLMKTVAELKEKCPLPIPRELHSPFLPQGTRAFEQGNRLIVIREDGSGFSVELPESFLRGVGYGLYLPGMLQQTQ